MYAQLDTYDTYSKMNASTDNEPNIYMFTLWYPFSLHFSTDNCLIKFESDYVKWIRETICKYSQQKHFMIQQEWLEWILLI